MANENPATEWEFDFRFDSARHDPDLQSGVKIKLKKTQKLSLLENGARRGKDKPPERHAEQQQRIPPGFAEPQKQPNTDFTIPLENRYLKVTTSRRAQEESVETEKKTSDLRSSSGEPLFTDKSLYLFNVIVALEWIPSLRTLQDLKQAFSQASDLLYDVTDGQMAFGQVIIGDHRFMPCADVQVMASNRYYPRSWVSGLMDAQKYTPVRLGRGWWRKDLGITLSWSDPVGSRVIAHEWCHYALGLLDEYLENRRVVIPKQSAQASSNLGRLVEPNDVYTLVFVRPGLATDSIMDNLEGSSELVPQGHGTRRERRGKIQKLINQHFADVDLSGPVLEGPDSLPIDLPYFPDRDEKEGEFLKGAYHEEWLLKLPSGFPLDHRWVYVLRPSEDKTSYAQVIPQGTLDDRAASEGFRLFGARNGDDIYIIGTKDGAPHGLRHKLDFVLPLREVTLPEGIEPQPLSECPVVTVIPDGPADTEDKTNTVPICDIRLRITNLPDHLQDPQKLQAWVFPIGGEKGERVGLILDGASLISSGQPHKVPSLDGQVLLTWNDEILIADYSEGGGPSTSVRAPEPPISAGSSEGNLMFYFAAYNQDPGDQQKLEHSRIRIVTTRNYGGFEVNQAEKIKPRSYLFSVASSQGISVDELYPTVVFTFDPDAAKKVGEFYIYSYDEKTSNWQLKPTYQPPFILRAAHPLEKGASGTALDPQDQDHLSYYYRLFFYEGQDEPPTAVPARANLSDNVSSVSPAR